MVASEETLRHNKITINKIESRNRAGSAISTLLKSWQQSNNEMELCKTSNILLLFLPQVWTLAEKFWIFCIIYILFCWSVQDTLNHQKDEIELLNSLGFLLDGIIIVIRHRVISIQLNNVFSCNMIFYIFYITDTLHLSCSDIPLQKAVQETGTAVQVDDNVNSGEYKTLPTKWTVF